MESSFALSGTLQLLKQKGLLVQPTDPKHVFVVSNDGIPEELKDIAAGKIDATVSQPADLYAKYALYYIKAAIDGQDLPAGPDRPRQHHHPGARRPARGPALRAAGHRGRRAPTAASQPQERPTTRCGATTSAEAGPHETRRKSGKRYTAMARCVTWALCGMAA